MKIEVTNIEFDSMETYIQWKEDIERSTHSSYVLKCAPTISNEAKVWYYYCNRAGVYKPDGKGKHQLKTQGTAKIGLQCTAHLRVSQHLLTQKISVQYCPTHYNHDLKLAFLRLPQKMRLDIANKLEQGVCIDRILDDIRDSVDGGIDRQHLITQQDIHKIKYQYNIEGITRHQNDLISVTAWVIKMPSLLTRL